MKCFRLMMLGVLAWPAIACGADGAPDQVLFNRDIRPILSDKCFFCHGPDKNKRQAELRLDVEENAKADRDGHRVLVPGKPAESELYRRITSTDADVRMPPAESHKSLSESEIELLRQWIEQGAAWQEHWA